MCILLFEYYMYAYYHVELRSIWLHASLWLQRCNHMPTIDTVQKLKIEIFTKLRETVCHNDTRHSVLCESDRYCYRTNHLNPYVDD